MASENVGLNVGLEATATPVDLMALRWYALTTVPSAEYGAQAQVKALGHKTLLPKDTYWQRVGATTKTEAKPYPIFRGYVFAGFDGPMNLFLFKQAIEGLLERMPGRALVRGVVGFGGKPAQLTQDDVRFLMQLNGRSLPASQSIRGLKVGDRARITSEAFRGHEVTVKDIDADAKKARILLSFFGTLQEIPISVAALEKIT